MLLSAAPTLVAALPASFLCGERFLLCCSDAKRHNCCSPLSHMAGVVPEHLGVLNLSFNRLSQLPKALGSAPVLQQMYLANNQLTDLPDTFSKLPMVDLFLSENLFTTIPKAVLGMTQVGYHSRPIVKHDPCAYSALWVSREMAQSFSGNAMAPIGEGKGTTPVGYFTV